MKEPKKTFEARKKDHIKWALDESSQNKVDSNFSSIKLIHRPLPELKFSDVNIETSILGYKNCSPFFISSMTAGHQQSKSLNARFMAAAEKKKWIFGVGSQKKELFDSTASKEWKTLRAKYSNAFVLSNIGIEQVISSPLDQVLEIQKNLQSNAIIVHLNSIQELFQNGFAGNFSMKEGYKAIEKLVHKSKVPVIVKEVGFGFDLDTLKKLSSIGVHVVDLAGHGGTHWGYVEALRGQKVGASRDQKTKGPNKLKMISAFDDWGYSNAEMLKKIHAFKLTGSDALKGTTFWASGGIRSGVDAAKCLCLGATAVGLAQPLMKACLKSEAALFDAMDEYELELKVAMFAMGVVDLKALTMGKNWYEKKPFSGLFKIIVQRTS